MKKWVLRKTKGNYELMSKAMCINKNLAQVLLNRGITKKVDIENFLNASLSKFYDFKKALGVTEGVNLIFNSIKSEKKIFIYGDYDCDGIMSTTILYKGLKKLGADVSFYIPHREKEGYGLNIAAISKLKSLGAQLIITCDNGIASIEENNFIIDEGIELLVIDHHEPPLEEIKRNYIVIDPKQSQCQYEFKEMCAAGLSFRFIYELFNFFNINFDLHDELLIFAMIATFCDIVDLKGDNRIIGKIGLEYINSEKNTNLGLQELIKVKGIDDKKLTNYHVGFIIGPCVNASGRLDRATLAVELFTSDSEEVCSDIAVRLYELNEERKQYTESAQKETIELLENSDVINDKVFVLYNNNVHESIAGIVAGRIKETYYHPVIVITDGEEGLKGSARSIESYNIFEEMSKCQKYFTKFGGHSMAAGVSLPLENLEDFRKEINDNCNLTNEDFCEIIPIDNQLEIEEVTYRLAEELGGLRPFGKGNKEPLFGTIGAKVEEIRIIEDKNTIIFTFFGGEGNRPVKGLSFGQVDYFKSMVIEKHGPYIGEKIFKGVLRNIDLIIDIVYYIDINEYNNNVSVQMKLKDFRMNNN